MTRQEILRLVNRYIGVTTGDLHDFSFRTLGDFYPLECNLDIDLKQYAGTKRERFEAILADVSPCDQAAIVSGILRRCPPAPDHPLRTQELHDEFAGIVVRLERVGGVGSHSPKITSAVVERAIADVENLISTTGATSGVDRVHTMLHGYMKAVCDDKGYVYGADPTILALFRIVREQHPAMTRPVPRAQDITLILKMMGSIMDVLNPIRNNASMAHPKDLLDPPEAMLVINAARTILHYVDSKLSE